MRTKRRNRRRLVDVALVVSFVAAFASHEAGVLVHFIVSIVFTAIVAVHVRMNWRTYRRPKQRARRTDHVTATGVIATTITGFTLWIGGTRFELGHGAISITLVVIVAFHIFRHRRSLAALISRRTRQTGDIDNTEMAITR